tara:strand:- start:1312 stop:1491 length:180 start_codon:yes stop_codon:yes gene_type:complete
MLKINFEFDDDWSRGYADAKSGLPHRAGMPKQYDEGYDFRKTKEVVADHWSEKQNVNFN